MCATEPSPHLPFLTRSVSDRGSFQEFSLQRMDGLADDRVNILGFSIFNQSHAFFQDFARSLSQSWQENCDHVPFPGPAVSTPQSPSRHPLACTHTLPLWASHQDTGPPGSNPCQARWAVLRERTSGEREQHSLEEMEGESCVGQRGQ